MSKATNARLSYDKLKQFLTACEQSQKVITTLEGDLKRLQVEVTQHYLGQVDKELEEQEVHESLHDSL